MKLGINIRVMGAQSSPSIIRDLLLQAEQTGVESAWIVDHIAIPPDDSEGSDGRYMDPLTMLAWMAAQTRRIKIGTSVLVLPYRPKLPTAKALATIQELSAGRLLLGVGVGWMKPEFDALGVDIHQRGTLTDEMLSFLHRCFCDETVTENGQPFLFRPRPTRPPIYIGGAAPHAIERALKFGDGWLPMGKLEKLKPLIAEYRQRAVAQGVPHEVTTFAALDSDDAKAQEQIASFTEAGVDRLIVGRPYQHAEDWSDTFRQISLLQQI
jgi:probable F420-dependent oxidoreductase